MNALTSDFTRADKKRKIMLKAEASTKKSLTMGVSGVCTIINLLRRKELIDINLNYNKNDSQSTKKTNLGSFKNNETQEMVEIKKGKFCRNFPEDNFKIDSSLFNQQQIMRKDYHSRINKC